MEQRGITERDVEIAWSNRFEERPGDYGTIWILGRAPGYRTLKMCVNVPSRDTLITAAWER